MTAKNRIIKFLEHLEIGQSAFEKKVGISNGYINNLKGSFGSKIIGKVSAAYPELNTLWLLTGEGDMLKGGDNESTTKKETDEDYALVPLYNYDVRGGMSGNNDVVDTLQYVERYVPFPAARKEDICVTVSGHSMEPMYSSGSIVLLREVPRWQEYFGFGGNFMIELVDGRRILKQVQKSSEDSKNQVLCVSYNPNFADEELPKSMINRVFKVLRSLTEEGY